MPGARDLKKEREGQYGPEDVVTTAPARRLPLQMANNCTQTAGRPSVCPICPYCLLHGMVLLPLMVLLLLLRPDFVLKFVPFTPQR
jgi:hypothetical protein